jgi:hypothetical protein
MTLKNKNKNGGTPIFYVACGFSKGEGVRGFVRLPKIETSDHFSKSCPPILKHTMSKPLSALLSQFPIRVLASEMEDLKDKEVLVKCHTMSGSEHIVAIADWQLSSTIALFAGHVCDVYHERIHLAIDCETLGMNVPMTEVAKRLKDDHVVQVLVKDPPNIIPYFMRPDILVGHRAYGPNPTDDGW